MKIAFYYIGNRLSYGNGIVSQALTWKKGLEKLGHEVTLCSSWDFYPLEKYDAIQIFGFNEGLVDYIKNLLKKNENIFLSPILDPDYSMMNARFRAHYGNYKIRISSRFSALRDSRKLIKGLLVRSEFEKNYMTQAFDYKNEQCHIVRLPSGVTPKTPFLNKEPYCLHISFLGDDRKNVRRLIEASVKYQFRLVLAGSLRNKKEEEKFYTWIKGHDNVEYRGWVTESEKLNLYSHAKVFALPSTIEGVGIVALEAACYGADVVITNLGGPKEYYGDYALKVNPYSVDEIGKSVKQYMNGLTFQPQLAEFIEENNSLEAISYKLEKIYNSI